MWIKFDNTRDVYKRQNLSNGGETGLRYANSNNAVGTARWNISLRLLTTLLQRHAASGTDSEKSGLGESLKLVETALQLSLIHILNVQFFQPHADDLDRGYDIDDDYT